MTYYTVSKPSTTYYEAFMLAIKTWKALCDHDIKTWAQLNALGLTTWKSLTSVAFAPIVKHYTVSLPTTTYYEVSV